MVNEDSSRLGSKKYIRKGLIMKENIYQKHGFNSRMEYLEGVSDDFGVPLSTVQALANILGPNEDFDGLITAVEDEADRIDSIEGDWGE